MGDFCKKIIETKEEFYRCQEDGWIYRGQSDSDWKIGDHSRKSV